LNNYIKMSAEIDASSSEDLIRELEAFLRKLKNN
jgi:hypothetical protein